MEGPLRESFGSRRLWYILVLSLLWTAAVSSVRPYHGWLFWTPVGAFAAASDQKYSVSVSETCETNPECEQASLAESTILEFLMKKQAELVQSSPTAKFQVQGWRWHTMSLVRESKRLGLLAKRLAEVESLDQELDESETSRQQPLLHRAVDYVVDFNMRGLHRIESDLFVPWMRQAFFQKIQEASVLEAFTVVLDRLEQDRKVVSQLGRLLKEDSVRASSSRFNDVMIQKKALRSMEENALKISSQTQDMLRLQDKLLVPTVALLVSQDDQKSFNNKVIRSLGLLDSRIHLVGMHEAVWELEDKSERDLFQETIPYLPRLMIPRWKRLLYEPKAGILDLSSSSSSSPS